MTVSQLSAERRGFLAVWQYRNYRYIWISALFLTIARWIETVVISWLVLEMTNSPFLVGLVATCRSAPMLLGPYFGTLCDRYDRRRILMAAQIIYGVSSLLLLILIVTSHLAVWQLFVFTFLGGLAFTVDFSTRYATASDVVKNEHLVTAVAVLFTAMGITNAFGPLIGGNLLDYAGAGGCFLLITACFAASFILLIPLKITPQKKAVIVEPTWRKLVSGLVYVKNNRALLALVLLAGLANFLIFPSSFSLLPLFARDVFKMGASGYGQLMATIGFGSVAGSLMAGSLPRFINKGKLVIATILVWPVFLLFFGNFRIFPLPFVLLFLSGLAQGITMAGIQSLLLSWSAPEMRGRVSGVRAFAISGLAFGNLLAGTGAGLYGAPMTLIILCSTSFLIIMFIALWASELRNRKKEVSQPETD